ncbi:DNA helicase UvrD [Candidatus Daviesbacteria bacterium]|nr:DNA helicase UvrD [Candidatus Daviesbacteria bacterium]
MPYVADLHIHSRFSRACSRDLNIPNLSRWAKFKGIDLLGTGDALHPLWFTELKKDLKESSSSGIYEYDNVKFLISFEISCIYSEGGSVRRIHTLVFLPSLDAAAKLSEALTKRGANLSSDGRPIVGLSSKQLCEVIFQVEPQALIVPAHIWTPWFSLYGSNSGYDKFQDCFGEFSDSVLAVETGLSSEPAMNWRVADLDNKSILSFSDLHSLPRLGREVTIIGGDLDYQSLRQALKDQNIVGTIEFFPEEGKYHYSGHRNCSIVFSPEDIKEKGEICPKCKRRLTIGVIQRVEELASRETDELRLTIHDGVTKSATFPNRAGFRMLVQLEEILAESLKSTVSSQKVKNEYQRLVTTLDPELKILTKTSLEGISKVAGEKVAEGIERVRQGKLKIEPGFDNTYGIVKIWGEDEEGKTSDEQISLF